MKHTETHNQILQDQVQKQIDASLSLTALTVDGEDDQHQVVALTDDRLRRRRQIGELSAEDGTEEKELSFNPSPLLSIDFGGEPCVNIEMYVNTFEIKVQFIYIHIFIRTLTAQSKVLSP